MATEQGEAPATRQRNGWAARVRWIVVLLAHITLKYTPFGRQIYAVGADLEAGLRTLQSAIKEALN